MVRTWFGRGSDVGRRWLGRVFGSVGSGPNTVSGSTVSNTDLSEFFWARWVPGSELSEFLSAYYLCANANSPSFWQNSPSLPQNSVSSLLRNSTLETVFGPIPNLVPTVWQKLRESGFQELLGPEGLRILFETFLRLLGLGPGDSILTIGAPLGSKKIRAPMVPRGPKAWKTSGFEHEIEIFKRDWNKWHFLTWSRPQSEFQVISFFPCCGKRGEIFGSLGGDKF